MHMTRGTYLIGLLIIFAVVYSQYLFGGKGYGLVLGAVIVYGVPIVATLLLGGFPIVRRGLNQTYTALKFGLGFFGAFTALGIIVSLVLLLIILTLDPSAINLLTKPNPLLNIPPQLAWNMVWISILIVGPAEEYLFRGFVYGGLLTLSKNRHWIILAIVSSILFTAVHLYYYFTYGIASSIQFTSLFTFGIAMAATYYLSGGNLIIPALIHGIYDATGFLSVATSSIILTVELRGFMIIVGLVVATVLWAQRAQKREQPSPVQVPIP